jgi:hypothetical protein
MAGAPMRRSKFYEDYPTPGQKLPTVRSTELEPRWRQTSGAEVASRASINSAISPDVSHFRNMEAHLNDIDYTPIVGKSNYISKAPSALLPKGFNTDITHLAAPDNSWSNVKGGWEIPRTNSSRTLSEGDLSKVPADKQWKRANGAPLKAGEAIGGSLLPSGVFSTSKMAPLQQKLFEARTHLAAAAAAHSVGEPELAKSHYTKAADLASDAAELKHNSAVAAGAAPQGSFPEAHWEKSEQLKAAYNRHVDSSKGYHSAFGQLSSMPELKKVREAQGE